MKGEFQGDVREGKGKYIFGNGNRYEGGWLNNLKHGFGYFYYQSGELYFGQW